MGKANIDSDSFDDWVNSILLVGRVTSEADEIELPSGESLLRFRMVVPRVVGAKEQPKSKATVDTIDCVAFKAVVQRKARSLSIGDVIELEGQLRRRFWKAGAGVASRVEVEVSSLKSVKI